MNNPLANLLNKALFMENWLHEEGIFKEISDAASNHAIELQEDGSSDLILPQVDALAEEIYDFSVEGSLGGVLRSFSNYLKNTSMPLQQKNSISACMEQAASLLISPTFNAKLLFEQWQEKGSLFLPLPGNPTFFLLVSQEKITLFIPPEERKEFCPDMIQIKKDFLTLNPRLAVKKQGVLILKEFSKDVFTKEQLFKLLTELYSCTDAYQRKQLIYHGLPGFVKGSWTVGEDDECYYAQDKDSNTVYRQVRSLFRFLLLETSAIPSEAIKFYKQICSQLDFELLKTYCQKLRKDSSYSLKQHASLPFDLESLARKSLKLEKEGSISSENRKELISWISFVKKEEEKRLHSLRRIGRTPSLALERQDKLFSQKKSSDFFCQERSIPTTTQQDTSKYWMRSNIIKSCINSFVGTANIYSKLKKYPSLMKNPEDCVKDLKVMWDVGFSLNHYKKIFPERALLSFIPSLESAYWNEVARSGQSLEVLQEIRKMLSQLTCLRMGLGDDAVSISGLFFWTLVAVCEKLTSDEVKQRRNQETFVMKLTLWKRAFMEFAKYPSHRFLLDPEMIRRFSVVVSFLCPGLSPLAPSATPLRIGSDFDQISKNFTDVLHEVTGKKTHPDLIKKMQKPVMTFIRDVVQDGAISAPVRLSQEDLDAYGYSREEQELYAIAFDTKLLDDESFSTSANQITGYLGDGVRVMVNSMEFPELTDDTYTNWGSERKFQGAIDRAHQEHILTTAPQYAAYIEDPNREESIYVDPSDLINRMIGHSLQNINEVYRTWRKEDRANKAFFLLSSAGKLQELVEAQPEYVKVLSKYCMVLFQEAIEKKDLGVALDAILLGLGMKKLLPKEAKNFPAFLELLKHPNLQILIKGWESHQFLQFVRSVAFLVEYPERFANWEQDEEVQATCLFGSGWRNTERNSWYNSWQDILKFSAPDMLSTCVNKYENNSDYRQKILKQTSSLMGRDLSKNHASILRFSENEGLQLNSFGDLGEENAIWAKKLVDFLLSQGILAKDLKEHNLKIESFDSSVFRLSHGYTVTISPTGDAYTIHKIVNNKTYVLVKEVSRLADYSHLKSMCGEDKIQTSSRIWLSSCGQNWILEGDYGSEEVVLLPVPSELKSLANKMKARIYSSGNDRYTLERGDFKMSFERKGMNLCSLTDPGYTLQNAYEDLLASHYVLEKPGKNSKVIVFLPSTVKGKENFCTLQRTPEGQWVLPKEIDDQLFYIDLFAEKDPLQAHAILDRISILKRLTEKEKSLLNQILLKAQGKIAEKEYISLALRICALKLDGFLKFPPDGQTFSAELPEFQKALAETALLYQKYLQKEGIMGPLRISVIEEKCILRALLTEGVGFLQKGLPAGSQSPSIVEFFIGGVASISNASFCDQSIPQADQALLVPHLQRRLDMLEHQTVQEGILKRVPIVIPTIAWGISEEDWMGQIRKFDQDSVAQIKSTLFAPEGQLLSKKLTEGRFPINTHFASYYHLAKTCSDKDREQLLRITSLEKHCCDQDLDNKMYIELLEEVVKNPQAYKQMDLLKEKLKEFDRLTKETEQAAQTLEELPRSLLSLMEYYWTYTYFMDFRLHYQLCSILDAASDFLSLIGKILSEGSFQYLAKRSFSLFPSLQLQEQMDRAEKPTQLNFQERNFQQADEKFNLFLNEIAEESVESVPNDRMIDLSSHLTHAKEQEYLKEYVNSRKATRLKITTGPNLEKICQEVERRQKEIETLEQELLLRASKWDLDTAEGVRKMLTTKNVDENTLKMLFLEGTQEGFLKATALISENIESFFNDLGMLYLCKAQLAQLERIRKEIDAWDKERELLKKELLGETLADSISQRRAYPISYENRKKLLVEACQGIVLRQDQVKKVSEVAKTLKTEGGKTLLEMPTGDGKTHVITPSSNLEAADGDKAIVNVFPKSIVESNIHAHAGEMERMGVKIDTMEFRRETLITPNTLHYLLDKMKDNISKGKPLDIYSESVRALELHLISLLSQEEIKALTRDEAKCVMLIREILSLQRKKGVAVIDEAKVNLSPQDRLIYTSGKRESLPERDIDTIMKFFQAFIETDDKMKELASKDRLNLVSTEMLQGVFVQKLAKSLSISEELFGAFSDFILGRVALADPRLFPHEARKQEICLVKGLNLLVLPNILQGRINKDYGFSHQHREKKGFAIPYLSANIPKETRDGPSEYQNPHETALKTLFALYHEGLGEKQLEKCLECLLEEWVQEKRQKMSGVLSIVQKNFREIFLRDQEEEILSHALRANFIQERVQEISRRKEAICYYFSRVIAPQVEVFPETIVSTNFDFLHQFSSTVSMIATPQATKAHGIDTEFVKTAGAKGFIPYHFFAKGEQVVTVDPENYESLLNSVATCLQSDHHALMDAAALFRGIGNAKIARDLFSLLRAYRKDIEGFVYFDDKEKDFYVLPKEGGASTPLYATQIAPENLFVFFDEPRTFGSDVKLGVRASGLVLIDEQVSEIGQANGRMRGIEKGQRLSFAVTNDFFQNLGLQDVVDKEKQKKAIYEHILSQGEEEERKFNTGAIKQQISAKVRNYSMTALIAADSLDELRQVYKKNRGEFITRTELEPSLLYENLQVDMDGKEDLEHYLKAAKHRIKQLNCLTLDQKAKAQENIECYRSLWEGEDSLLILEKVTSGGASLGNACDVLLQTEQEVDTQVEQEVSKQRPFMGVRGVSSWKEDIDLFSPGWEKVREIRRIWDVYGVLHRAWRDMTDQMTTIWDWCIEVSHINELTKQIPYEILATLNFQKNVIMQEFKVLLAKDFIIDYPKVAFAGITAMLAWFYARPMYESWYEKAPPLFRVRDVAEKELGPIADQVFDADLLVSNNYANLEPTMSMLGAQEMFTNEQKNLYHLLFLLDEGKTQAVLVDQNDVITLKKFFVEDFKREADVVQRKRKVVLYDLQTDAIIRQGRNRILEEELRAVPNFRCYTAQAKLFGRQYLFNAEEQKEIESKISTLSPVKMRQVFHRIIAREERGAFNNSPIGVYLKKQEGV